MADDQNLLRRLRREAKKQGYSINKSRADMNTDNLGGYMVTDSNNCIVAGERFDMFIGDLAEFLN